jgi:hypothetical protein
MVISMTLMLRIRVSVWRERESYTKNPWVDLKRGVRGWVPWSGVRNSQCPYLAES